MASDSKAYQVLKLSRNWRGEPPLLAGAARSVTGAFCEWPETLVLAASLIRAAGVDLRKTLVRALALSRWFGTLRGSRDGRLAAACLGGRGRGEYRGAAGGKGSVNLNFTAGRGRWFAIERCGIKTILSSAVFRRNGEELPAWLSRTGREEITPIQKGLAAICALLLPSRILGGVYAGASRAFITVP
jgi:hypothetical protein